MDGQHVGPAEQLVGGHIHRPRLFGGLAGEVRAPRDDVHAERRPDTCHPGADPAQAEHAEHFAGELAAERGLPAAGPHRQGFVDDPPGRREDERPGEFDGGLDVAAGRAHVNAVLLCGRGVDRRVVRSGRRDHLQVLETLDDVARQRRPLPHDADHVERPEPVTTASGSARWSLNTVMSARAATLDQSAMLSATF